MTCSRYVILGVAYFDTVQLKYITKPIDFLHIATWSTIHESPGNQGYIIDTVNGIITLSVSYSTY